METANLNAELFKNLGYLATDESYMKKALGYIKKLAARKEAQDEQRLQMKKELTEMCEQVKLAKRGKIEGEPAENLFNELCN